MVVAGERDLLDVERDALVSLVAWSADQERFQRVSVSQALADLAELTRREVRRSSRLVVLERIVRGASRRGEEFRSPENEGLQLLLEALLVEGGVAPPLREAAIDAVRRALELVEGLVMTEAYPRFAELTRETVALRDHEVFAPTCNDDAWDRPPEGTPARILAAEFYSALPYSEFTQWMDPKEWPALCPWFFRAMGEVSPPHATKTGWWQVHDETVEVIAGEPWTTRLWFGHKWRKKTQEMRTEYRFPNPDAVPPEVPPKAGPAPTPQHLLVDHGHLGAEHFTAAHPGFITRVTLVKIAKFADPQVDKWSSLMCDTFWLDLAIQMADAAANLADPANPDPNA